MEAESQLKPPILDELEEDWQEWFFVMRAVLGGQHERSQQLLDAAEAADTRDLSNTRIQALMGDEGLQANKKMYSALVMTTKGPAQMILRGQERHNGAVCWRALCKRFEPATAVRAQCLMLGILNVTAFPETNADFEENHGEWERSIQRYELASGESFNTGVKKSIFLQNAPKNMRTLLQMQRSHPYEGPVAQKCGTCRPVRSTTASSCGQGPTRQRPRPTRIRMP